VTQSTRMVHTSHAGMMELPATVAHPGNANHVLDIGNFPPASVTLEAIYRRGRHNEQLPIIQMYKCIMQSTHYVVALVDFFKNSTSRAVVERGMCCVGVWLMSNVAFVLEASVA